MSYISNLFYLFIFNEKLSCHIIFFIRFYDGICKWEEESQTPILHIGWAKPLVSTISKFDADVRAQVNIVCFDESSNDEPPDSNPNTNSKDEKKSKSSDSSSTSDGNDKSSNGTKKQDNSTGDVSSHEQKEPNQVEDKSLIPPMLGINPENQVKELGEEMEAVANSHPTTVLYSHKMKGLKDLLLAEKLNTHAISLHLTAQSQVFVNKKQKVGEVVDPNAHCSIRPKRVRRE